MENYHTEEIDNFKIELINNIEVVENEKNNSKSYLINDTYLFSSKPADIYNAMFLQYKPEYNKWVLIGYHFQRKSNGLTIDEKIKILTFYNVEYQMILATILKKI